MALLIDTDLLIDAERRPDAQPLDELAPGEPRAVSVITVSELLHGVHHATGARRARRQAFVEHLLAGLEPLPVTEPIARVHARLWADLDRRGERMGAHDLWIAATALAHGFGLATRNVREFGRVEGLRILG